MIILCLDASLSLLPHADGNKLSAAESHPVNALETRSATLATVTWPSEYFFSIRALFHDCSRITFGFALNDLEQLLNHSVGRAGGLIIASLAAASLAAI